MEKIDSYKVVIEKHIIFFNKFVSGTLFNLFRDDSVQNSINNRQGTHKRKYLKQHYLKTYNLLLAIIVLSGANPYKNLIDEGKIIFRTLFENIINFLYIFSFDTSEERQKLIRQFYDYLEIAIYRYPKKIFQKDDKKSSKTNEFKKVLNMLMRLNIKDSIYIKENEYKIKYKVKNLNTWSGKTMADILNELNNKYPEMGFEFYQKYYYDTNPYVHCNILEYMNEDGVIVENSSNEDKLDLIHKSIFLFLGYSEAYFNLLGKETRKEYPELYRYFDDIEEQYHSLYQGPQTIQV